MPCDIGYRSYAKVVIPEPEPQEFKEKFQAPKIDVDMLNKLGIEDPKFVQWLTGLDIVPLLKEALKRTLKNISGAEQLNYSIDNNGNLTVKGDYLSTAKKRALQKLSEQVNGRFQFEVLAVVVQILGYEYELQEQANRGQTQFKLIAEKHEDAKVHKYIEVSQNEGKAVLRFEHFSNMKELEAEEARFITLAQKLRINIQVQNTRRKGQPIPGNVEHRHFIKHKERS
ncbi:hypothetical protein COT97_02735 [Candidatus Falkowbacteria bacterium CG10_big_fil_rev_8_21_14_0_10_39_11]|uniref:Uncharacterized protein n=1 Tax=Candidatus Falkowbacteria bacterium CG10_big_fil_rev_8_21_14_0_10_39_11 TaxID=1974565 RepID=A0A2H0V6Y1_9BACT|nr:MAG: hypothetical protein COT97_02735 [Candidatus Falkowbacteria bacterium CG10_big_fil_rev_8_21_14_0_10_39_11]